MFIMPKLLVHLCRRPATVLLLASMTAAAAAQERVPAAPEAEPAEQQPAEQSEAAPQPFRVGIVPRGDVRTFLKALEPFRRGLAKVLGRPVEILPISSLSALVDAQVLKRIDAGFYSATAYVTAEALCNCLEPLVAPAATDGSTAYHALIVARADSGIDSLSDLEGKRVATGPADSVAARQVQLAGLRNEGYQPDSFFAGLTEAKSAVAAVRMALRGEVDAAFAWSSLKGKEKRGHSRGTLAFLVSRGELAMEDVVIVWRSRPIGHGPFAVLRSLPEKQRAALERYLVRLADARPVLYDRLDLFYGGGFRPVEPADYRAVALTVDKGNAAAPGRQ